MCLRGFHACPKLIDCFYYYDFAPDNKVALVRLWGKVEEDGNKLVANNIHIEKEILWNEVLDMVNDGLGNTGRRNNGDCNSGQQNIGDSNTGVCNIGNRNSGDNNVGDYNIGRCNIGDHNSGNYNVGSYNTGNNNKGNGNSGSFNVGSFNVGNFNIGNYHMGWFNTESHGLCWFNKPVDPSAVRAIRIPPFLRNICITAWKHLSSMPENQRLLSPEAKHQGGYLERKTLKAVIKEAFKTFKKYGTVSIRKYEFACIKALPNFDPDIFYEITGIKLEELD